MPVLEIPRQFDAVGGWIDLLVILGKAAKILVGDGCTVDSPDAENLERFGQVELGDKLSLRRGTEQASSGNCLLSKRCRNSLSWPRAG